MKVLHMRKVLLQQGGLLPVTVQGFPEGLTQNLIEQSGSSSNP